MWINGLTYYSAGGWDNNTAWTCPMWNEMAYVHITRPLPNPPMTLCDKDKDKDKDKDTGERGRDKQTPPRN